MRPVSSARPFLNLRIDELEARLAEQAHDAAFVKLLLEELWHRRGSRRVRDLQAKAGAALSAALRQPASARPAPEPISPASPPPPTGPAASASPADAAFTNRPLDILDAWAALEVLSPQSFRRPEDLADGDRARIAECAAGALPWFDPNARSRPNMQLFYQVVLGSIALPQAFDALLTRHAETRAERRGAAGEAVAAVLLLDRHGCPVAAPAAAVSSFAWGLPIALAGDLRALAGWSAAEASLVAALDRRVRRRDPDGRDLPLDRSTITEACDWLVETLRLPAELVLPPRLVVRTFQHFTNPDPPDPMLLNSFFLRDLARARAHFVRGDAPATLSAFLGQLQPSSRKDLLADRAALRDALRPTAIPSARWPGPGRHGLVALQQAAVNLAMRCDEAAPILAVNGPPGTGKTTLLRDIVAAVVTQRALVMASFDDPNAAFTASSSKLRVGKAAIQPHRLDQRLRGFELLVASSNNRAVENVSAELPALANIAADADDLRYLTTLSDALREPPSSPTWGAIAAVLGNAGNRSRFAKAFWWDDDTSIARYLSAAASPAGGEQEALPRIVAQERPPAGPAEALQAWRIARRAFQDAHARARDLLAEVDRAQAALARLPELQRAASAAAEDADRRATAAAAAVSRAAARMHEARLAAGALAAAEQAVAVARQARPGLMLRLLRTARYRQWRDDVARLEATRAQGATFAAQTRAAAADAEHDAASAGRAAAEARAQADRAAALRDAAEAAAAPWRSRLAGHAIDQTFSTMPHRERHLTVPWLDRTAQRARDDVFVAAMRVHRAFLAAAARPLHHNLGAMMRVFGRGADARTRPVLADLWASLFLVVPVLSTTFASVDRMLAELPAEALGWLLIDEAGQALPQAAVGALMRSRRAIVVGDPMQIEPVVVLPPSLTQAICAAFDVDPDRFDAPVASVQTLADGATAFSAEFTGRSGSRTVGVPLLVHRRCAEPMFGIANAIAYDRLMVQAKQPGRSSIRDRMGSSRWIDVEPPASTDDKWSAAEGQVAVELLAAIGAAGAPPDVYLITPFVVVQDRLRAAVDRSGLLERWNQPRAWLRERIGTVHVVQGREAEAVIFVLGAPLPGHAGARAWAGGQPNLLNVAVTRAKEAIYVVGNRRAWQAAGVFGALHRAMPFGADAADG
jgi:hypothetical protein